MEEQVTLRIAVGPIGCRVCSRFYLGYVYIGFTAHRFTCAYCKTPESAYQLESVIRRN